MDGKSPWDLPLSQVLQDLQSSRDGLTAGEARRRLGEHGANEVGSGVAATFARQLLERLANPLILILLFAGSISAWTGDTISFAIIVLIVGLSVALDLTQQRRADAAVRALQRSVALKAEVVRDSRSISIPTTECVPGDVIHLSAGDIVPADSRLLLARDFFVNQAMMTGESIPVEKHARDLTTPAESEQAADNWLFMGTSVLSGTATAVICRTGKAAAIAGIARSLSAARPRDEFERGMRRFGYLMLRLTTFLVLFVVTANVLFQRPWLESLLFALALAVGLTPELLPMVVTVTLAKGAQRMASKRVIVKRLAAIHDLGAMDVLCTDKTGTLTEANIRLIKWLDAHGTRSGRVLELAIVNSFFETGLKSPLDAAILACGPRELATWKKIDEVPFDFERRRVSVLAERAGERILIIKGAPEDILGLSTTVAPAQGLEGDALPIDREALATQFERLGDEGFRVLAVAYRPMRREDIGADAADESGLTFAGFLAFADPPKAGCAKAIDDLSRSGVDLKILTGDNERIARHVCLEIGEPITGILTGPELAHLGDDALKARLPGTNIFCRVTPQQKQRVIAALKGMGKVVGFLGDGVNDAPALHAADVGISVDTAADVAKAAADIVLLDHDLNAVHAGVLEGRHTVENVSKYILMGTSSNFGNMFSMAGAALFLPFLPMLPTQVLLNNLLYDLSEVGIPFDNVDEEVLRRPIHWDVKLVERFMLIIGPVSSAFDFLTFFILLEVLGVREHQFQTGWFLESLATQVCVVWIIRTRRAPWRSRPHQVLVALAASAIGAGLLIALTPLGKPFEFAGLPAGFFVFLVLAVVVYLVAVEGIKRAFFGRWETRAEAPTPGARNNPVHRKSA